jgi:flagellar biosynthesis chaperone FliJ
MGQRIDQFCEQLRIKLTQIDGSLRDLKGKIDTKASNADKDVQAYLDKVDQRIDQDQAKVSAAQAKMEDWVEARKVETRAKIADWKSRRETSKLNNRADRAEQYAAAAIVVASVAVDEAERASVEAWLARQDADAAPAKQTASA